MECNVDQISSYLKDYLNGFHLPPVLFAGSGLSLRYLGTPRWADLLKHFALEIGKEWEYFQIKSAGDCARAASLIAQDYFDYWWYSRPDGRRKGECGKVDHSEEPFKIAVADYIASFSELPDQCYQRELKQLSASHIHAIITTNWDSLLERHFRDFQIISGQDGILKRNIQGVAEIYKIHGSCDDPKNLVLTSRDYRRFHRKNSYLTAKLTTFFTENPIIFMGYSLQDANIREILRNLVRGLCSEDAEMLNARLLFVRREGDGRRAGIHPADIDIGRHRIGVHEIVTNHFSDIYQAMQATTLRCPTNVLRFLKDQIYEVIVGSSDTSKMAVIDIYDGTKFEDIEMVVGVGITSKIGNFGYKRFDRDRLARAMLEKERLDGWAVVKDTLPDILRRAKYAPMFYFLRLAGLIDGREITGIDEWPAAAQDFAQDPNGICPYYHKTNNVSFQTFREQGSNWSENRALACSFSTPGDISALRTYLLERLAGTNKRDTPFFKLVCRYDALVYGPNAPFLDVAFAAG